MWSGPVGLAETNSTLTCRGRSARARPQASGSASTPATSSSRARIGQAHVEEAGRRDLDGRDRRARRARPRPPAPPRSPRRSAGAPSGSGRASFIARLVARSPCSGLAGRSISTGGRSAAVRGRGRQGARGDGAGPGGGHGVADALPRRCQAGRRLVHRDILAEVGRGVPRRSVGDGRYWSLAAAGTSGGTALFGAGAHHLVDRRVRSGAVCCRSGDRAEWPSVLDEYRTR